MAKKTDPASASPDQPQIGDRVLVRYLTDSKIPGIIVKEFTISAARAEELKKYYPDVKAGDKGYSVDAGGGDTKSFLGSEIEIVAHPLKRAPKQGDQVVIPGDNGGHLSGKILEEFTLSANPDSYLRKERPGLSPSAKGYIVERFDGQTREMPRSDIVVVAPKR